MHLRVRTSLATLAFLVSALMPALANAQSCSISISPQTGATGSGRTLSWAASGSTINMYISGIGWVMGSGNNGNDGWYYYMCSWGNSGYCNTRSGSLTIYPSSSYTYTGTSYYDAGNSFLCTPGNCYGGGGTVSCSDTAYAYPPASCSVSLSPDPKSYAGASTLSWSSSDAHYWVYINNVGYVGSSGSTSVSPTSSTDYSCYAYGYGGSDGWHSAVLSVNPPANCTFNGATVNHSSSVTAYQASTVSYGNSCVSQTRTCSNGTLSGSYAYSTCTVDNPPPTCSLSASPTSVAQGNSSTLSWSSSNATSCTGTNFSTGGATSGSVSVSPSSSTTYLASCTGAGGTASCIGTGSGGIGAALSISCTQAWACTGTGSATITRTNTDCSTTNIDTCVSPLFCSPGSATCLYNAITGSISASPRIVPSGRTTTISWSTSNAVACTVTGNGDTWTGTSGSHTSSPITQLSRYTIVCDDADADTTQDDYSSSVTVVRVPSWLEL